MQIHFPVHPSPTAVQAYVIEEVQRQGYTDMNYHPNVWRVVWMLDAWRVAQGQGRKPEINDAELLGRLIEPLQNPKGFRKALVFVGSHTCPGPEDLERLLTKLWEVRDELTPLEFYKEFELIHPFRDGMRDLTSGGFLKA